jgi:transposase
MKMYCISKEDATTLRTAMKSETVVLRYRKMEAVALRGEGKKNDEIAVLTGFHSDMVGRYAKEYIDGGLDSLLADGRKGGNHRNMSFEEEAAFLEPFMTAAEAGQIVEVSTIKQAYEEKTGRELKSHGHIYQVLNRHGWRKVMPRSKHPNKASEEEIESSKKLTIE